LHLTDLHFGQEGQRPLWSNVRDALFDDLPELHKLCGPWNAVLFTGDLVQKGSPEEFAQLERELLARLWEELHRLGSGEAVLLAVPGNHDLVRPSSLKPPPALRQLLRPDGLAEVEGEFWHEPESDYRRIVSTAFASYQSWWRQTQFRGHAPVQEGLLPGDFAVTLNVGSHAVGVVGLNTTFLQLTGGDYKGHLAWDVCQLQAVCNGDAGDWLGHHEVCLLLTHQGPDWLDVRSREAYPEINPGGRFAAHLFGHMHEAAFQSTSYGGGRPLRYWQGCSLCGLEKYGEPPQYDRRHGYSVGSITFGERPSLRFWPRKANKSADGWRFVPDQEGFVLQPDGGTEAQLVDRPVKPRFPKSVGSSTGASESSAPALETLSWLQEGSGPSPQDALIRRYIQLFSKNVEQVVRREVRQFIDLFSKDAFQAVLERIVPEAVFLEIRNILNSEVIRSDCEYKITFKKPYPGMPAGYFVIQRALSFKVRNLLNRSAIFPVRSSYSGDEDPTSAAWLGRHYHLDLSVNNQKITIEKDKNLFLREGVTVLDEPVRLAPQGEAEIFLRSEEPCRIEAGRNSYIQGTPLIGIEVDVRNEYPEEIGASEVQMNHPAASEMICDQFGRYILKRAFLPGQGFQVLWKKKREESTAQSGS